MYSPVAYIFGYGSLVDPNDFLISQYPDAEKIYGILDGYERHWEIAIDNMSPATDHKYYVDSETGERHNGYVGMLGLEKSPGAVCNGVAILADQELFDDIQRRETSIYSISDDLRDSFSTPLDYPLYTYLASPEGYSNRSEAETLVIPRGYSETVEAAFESLGAKELETYLETTRRSSAILLDLDLFRLPGKEGI